MVSKLAPPLRLHSLKDLCPLLDPGYAAHLQNLEEEKQRVLSYAQDSWQEYRNEMQLDTLSSPEHREHPLWTPEYEAKRRAKRPLIPPPQDQAKRKRESEEQANKPAKRQQLESTSDEIGKIARRAPRRPRTRSMGLEEVALHPHKRRKVMRWFFGKEYAVMSHKEYWRDYALEGPRYTSQEIKRRYPFVQNEVLDQYGGLASEDDPYPPHRAQELPPDLRTLQHEIDTRHKLYPGEFPWR